MKYVYLVVAYDKTDYDTDPRLVCAYLEEGPANTHAKEANLHVAKHHSGQYNYAYDNPFDPNAKTDRIWEAPWYDVDSVELMGC